MNWAETLNSIVKTNLLVCDNMSTPLTLKKQMLHSLKHYVILDHS